MIQKCPQQQEDTPHLGPWFGQSVNQPQIILADIFDRRPRPKIGPQDVGLTSQLDEHIPDSH